MRPGAALPFGICGLGVAKYPDDLGFTSSGLHLPDSDGATGRAVQTGSGYILLWLCESIGGLALDLDVITELGALQRQDHGENSGRGCGDTNKGPPAYSKAIGPLRLWAIWFVCCCLTQGYSLVSTSTRLTPGTHPCWCRRLWPVIHNTITIVRKTVRGCQRDLAT
jgi:hypothetical protein